MNHAGLVLLVSLFVFRFNAFREISHGYLGGVYRGRGIVCVAFSNRTFEISSRRRGSS